MDDFYFASKKHASHILASAFCFRPLAHAHKTTRGQQSRCYLGTVMCYSARDGITDFWLLNTR